jgi:outer membrane protein OmpA-like peptidoglycan-associated protein
MTKLSSRPVALALWALATAATAATPPADRRNFVSCPIVRDTKTVPCWLSEYKGETYYLGYQGDFGAEFWPPYLGHQVMVEGQVTDAPRICGGVVLKPIKISPMPEPDANCNTMLPAEDRYTIPMKTRGPGPNNRPSINLPPPPPRAAPPPLQGQQQFTMLYTFDNRVWNIRTAGPLKQAGDYAVAAHAKQVEVVSYRGASLLSDGTVLAEGEQIAQTRAEQVADYLQQIGVPADHLKVRWETTPLAPNGVDDPTRRKTVITVTP